MSNVQTQNLQSQEILKISSLITKNEHYILVGIVKYMHYAVYYNTNIFIFGLQLWREIFWNPRNVDR